MKKMRATTILLLAVSPLALGGDLQSELMAREKAMWDAWKNRDSATFRQVTEDHVQIVAGLSPVIGRDALVASVAADTCEAGAFELSDPRLRQLTPDVAILSYTGAQVATCDGVKLPPRVHSTAVYVRRNGTWSQAHYQETPAP